MRLAARGMHGSGDGLQDNTSNGSVPLPLCDRSDPWAGRLTWLTLHNNDSLEPELAAAPSTSALLEILQRRYVSFPDRSDTRLPPAPDLSAQFLLDAGGGDGIGGVGSGGGVPGGARSEANDRSPSKVGFNEASRGSPSSLHDPEMSINIGLGGGGGGEAWAGGGGSLVDAGEASRSGLDYPGNLSPSRVPGMGYGGEFITPPGVGGVMGHPLGHPPTLPLVETCRSLEEAKAMLRTALGHLEHETLRRTRAEIALDQARKEAIELHDRSFRRSEEEVCVCVCACVRARARARACGMACLVGRWMCVYFGYLWTERGSCMSCAQTMA